MDLFASAATLSRWDSEIQASRGNGQSPQPNNAAAELFLRQSARRIRNFLDGLGDNDDKFILQAAEAALGQRGDAAATSPVSGGPL